jgi:DNA-binding response OmpR family regulator
MEMRIGELSTGTRQAVPKQQGGVAALAIMPDEKDRRCIRAVFETSKWGLRFASDAIETQAALESESVPVMIIDGDVKALSWRDFLQRISASQARRAPKLIVVSRLADDLLWSEVLNRGGYDLLAKPLDAHEVERIVRSALSEPAGVEPH